MLKLNFSEQNLERWQIRNTFCLELIIYMLAHTFLRLSHLMGARVLYNKKQPYKVAFC